MGDILSKPQCSIDNFLFLSSKSEISFKSLIVLLHFLFKDVPIEHNLSSGKEAMICH